MTPQLLENYVNNARRHPMTRFFSVGAIAALLLIALSGVGFSASKNYAVVVGVDQSAGASASLKGASNDARAFAEQLRGRGIEPVVLLNGQATRPAISAAIKNGAKAEQLIFYFAGMGSGPNVPRLMTAEDNKGFTLEALDKALLEAGAGSTTVILDTSFNGSRASKSGPSLFTSRYLQPTVAARGEQVAADASAIPGVSHNKICYITAARFNQEAYEDSFGGKARGVFSHYLCDRLSTDQKLAWQTIQWDVAAQVSAHVDGTQNPTFPTNYLAQAALEGNTVAPAEYGAAAPKSAGGQNVASRTLWTLFNVDNVNPRLVSLAMRPNKAEVAVNEPLEFELTVGKPGYLVVVEHSVEGTLMPIFPRNGDIETARVQAGQKVVIPEPGIVAFADRPGKERLKALLFEEKEAADQLLAGLQVPTNETESHVGATFGKASKRLQERGIRFARSAPNFGAQENINGLPITADLYFQVVPE